MEKVLSVRMTMEYLLLKWSHTRKKKNSGKVKHVIVWFWCSCNEILLLFFILMKISNEIHSRVIVQI